MTKTKNKQITMVEEVICPESGKIYLAPCQVRCPLKLDIQRSHTAVSQLPSEPIDEEVIEIGNEIFEKNPLFPIICGNICGLCEEECNYKDETGAIRRRKIIWPVGKIYLKHLEKMPKLPAPAKEKVAVVGGGPGGLMCAYELSKKGYTVTIFDKNSELGGALRYIPKYRLPTKILNSIIENIVRIANIKVKKRVFIGQKGISLEDLKKKGFKAIFMATGTPNPRGLPLQEKNPEVEDILQKLSKGDDSHGIKYGLNLLYQVDRGDVPLDLYKDKKVVVVGGGNVAFDVARTARRLGGKVTLMCLECKDKSCKDGIPADIEEIEGAEEEGIDIIYSRGVYGIETKEGIFNKVKTVVCKSVFTKDGRFSPEFDTCKMDSIQGDVLLITIGQGPDNNIYQDAGLINDKGRIDINPVTLMSNRKKGVFIGGDVLKIGFASEAMRDGTIAAENIENYLSGKEMKKVLKTEYEEAETPHRLIYKEQPKIVWKPAKDRMNFEPFEKEYTWEEVITEATRCLYCGPCKSCKGCVFLEFQEEIPDIEVDKDKCSGCAVCIALCPYDALKLIKKDNELHVLEIDDLKCKRCGVCVTACPSNAITIKDDFRNKILKVIKNR